MPLTCSNPQGAGCTLPLICSVRRMCAAGRYRDEERQWVLEATLEDGHQDWVRDVAWAPSIGLPGSVLATCGQDKQVLIWSKDREDSQWSKVRPGLP